MFTDTRTIFSSLPQISHTGEMETPIEIPAHQNPLDDVFDDDTESLHTETRRNEAPSDVPRLQGIHTTNGYREGVAAYKEKFLQEGFDEGYALGAEIGAAAGQIIGVLEAMVTAVREEGDAHEILEKAKGELSAKNLYGEEYFGADGIWKYEVEGEKEGDVTFRVVAGAHPLIRKWEVAMRELISRYGLEF